jgi:hypothetical protein
MFQQLLFVSSLVTAVLGQSAYSDAKSGIAFSQGIFSSPNPKISFGIALPTDAKSDFIAHIVRNIVDCRKLSQRTKL